MNLNDLAQEVTLQEGMKQPLTIAQVKEVLRILATIIYTRPALLIKLLQYGQRLNK